jgi:hypothetical protein
MAAERARRALQTYLAIGLGATLLLVIGGVLILALGGLGEEGGNQSQQVAADGAVVRPAANTPPRPVRPGTPRPITPTPVTPEPPSPETPVQSDPMPSDPMPSDPMPSDPVQPMPMPTPPPQSDPPPYRPIPGEPIRDPSFIPGPEPVRRTEPPTPMPEPPQPGTDPVPNPEPPKPETPPMPVAPTAEELAELGRLLTSARQSLSDLNVDAAKTSLAKAEPLARLPEHKQKFDRLQRMADYVGRFREALAESVSKLEPASSIMVGTSTQVGIVETFPNRITVRVAGMNRTYAFEELPVGLAVAIVDLVQLPADESQLIKGAYVMVSKTANDLNREKARTWWEEAGPELGDLMSFVDDSYGFSP